MSGLSRFCTCSNYLFRPLRTHNPIVRYLSTDGTSGGGLTHVDTDGNARMVDLGSKRGTLRTATAEGTVVLGRVAYNALSGTMSKKGDIFSVAQVAGILAAKQTSTLIPLCHSVALSSVKLDLKLNDANYGVDIQATAKTPGDARTGVEMEALTAVSVAALTIYDMCKAADKGIEIRQVRLVSKTGGVSGDYKLEDKQQN